MNRPRLKTMLLICTAFTGLTARADILFIDMNGSRNEVHAARVAAATRREKLVVIPELSAKRRNQIERLEAKIAPLESRKSRLILAYDRVDSMDERAQISLELAEVMKELKPAHEGIRQVAGGGFDPEIELKNALAAANQSRTPFTSLIISGHSNGTSYSGSLTTTDLQYDKMVAIFHKHPWILYKLRSIFAWGCYSTTANMASRYYKDFPMTQVVLGFSEVGPSGRSDASPVLLKDALLAESAFAAEQDPAASMRRLSALRAADGTSVAGMINSSYVGMKVEPRNLTAPPSDCDAAMVPLKAQYLQIFRPYYHAAGKSDPPIDTHHSELRSFYGNLQAHLHCPEVKATMPKREQVLGLIFYRNVKDNFAAYYASKIERADQILAVRAAPTRVRFGPISSDHPSRKEALERLAAITAYLESKPDLSDAERKTLWSMRKAYATLLGDINCVPLQWSTEGPLAGVTPVPPTCVLN